MINLIGILLSVLLYTYSDARAIEFQEFNKKWSSCENVTYHFSRNPASYKNNFVFAACTLIRNYKEMDCTVTVEKLQMQDRSAAKNFCRIKLIADENKVLSPNKISGLYTELEVITSIEVFSNDHVIVAWFEKSGYKGHFHDTLKVRILKMETCTFVAPTLHFFVDENIDSVMSQLLPYQDTFDVALSNKKMCNGKPSCRMSYNIKGRQVSGSVPLAVHKHTKLYPVLPSSSVKGFFGVAAYYKAPQVYINLYYISPNNSRIDLIDENISRFYWPRAVSNAHERLGSCWMHIEKLILRCVQFDPEIEDMMVMNVTLKLNAESAKENEMVQVHNLKESGILLATLTNQNKSIDGVESKNLIVQKINSDGSQQKIVKITGLDFKCSIRTIKILENDKKICFYFLCKNKYDGRPLSSYLSVNVKCISNYDK